MDLEERHVDIFRSHVLHVVPEDTKCLVLST